MSIPAFWPFPMPVETPLGQGYILYSVPQPMYENDTHLVQLDDGRLLHFSTNQLRGVPNGTYDLAMPKRAAKPSGNAEVGSTGVPVRHRVEVGNCVAACGQIVDANTPARDWDHVTCRACLTVHVTTLFDVLLADDGIKDFAEMTGAPTPPQRPPRETLKAWSASRVASFDRAMEMLEAAERAVNDNPKNGPGSPSVPGLFELRTGMGMVRDVFKTRKG